MLKIVKKLLSTLKRISSFSNIVILPDAMTISRNILTFPFDSMTIVSENKSDSSWYLLTKGIKTNTKRLTTSLTARKTIPIIHLLLDAKYFKAALLAFGYSPLKITKTMINAQRQQIKSTLSN